MMDEKKKPAPRGSYIPSLLDRHCLNGDAYIMVEDAYNICTGGKRPYQMFQGDLAEQLKRGKVHQEGRRLYLTKVWEYETSASFRLADILQDNNISCPTLSEDLSSMGDVHLSEEQCDAVRMALAHRLSVILGGAGTGKTTLIEKIIEEQNDGLYVLTATTGKAAQNLTARIGERARTLHSALGLRPDEDDKATSPVIWEHTSLIVVDEASMMTTELLAYLLRAVRKKCCIVLVGDPEQLLSVGSGNVLPDLLALGIPCTHLHRNFRQEEKETALYHNVVEFPSLTEEKVLCYDESFRLEQMSEIEAETALIEEAVKRYASGESIQVLSPYNSKTRLSVQALNRSLQARLNPATPDKKELVTAEGCFRDGDRVIITRNDHERRCVNGDVGILRVEDDNMEMPRYHVELADGRRPAWDDWDGLAFLSHAFALTIHKSQGSQYNTVLVPIVAQFGWMLYRNLLYTAISRAKKQVILYGGKSALDAALRTSAKPRKSMLVSKTRMVLLKRAA